MSEEPMIIEVVGIVAGVPTKNGRIYTEECLKQMVEGCQGRIKEGSMFVCNQDELELDASVRLGNIAAKVIQCDFDPVRGTVSVGMEFLDTPAGKQVKEMLSVKKLGVSVHNIRLTPCTIAEMDYPENIVRNPKVTKFIVYDERVWE
jgi:hypothetical protein